MSKKRFAVYAILLLGLPAMLAVEYVQDKADQIRYDKTRQIGNEIVVALLRYRIDKGMYPDKLDELVSADYIPDIEQPVWGDGEWIYFSSIEDEPYFYIEVIGHGERDLTYSTDRSDWHNNPKATPVD